MRLSRVHIHGFRSLLDIQAELDMYTSAIGPNDTGKSSFLRAVHLLLDPETTPQESDICRLMPPDEEAWVEGTLVDCPADAPFARHGTGLIRRHLSQRPYLFEYLGDVPANPLLKRMSEGTLTRGDFQTAPPAEPWKERTATCLAERAPSGRVPPEIWKDVFRELDANALVEREEGWCQLEPDSLTDHVRVLFLDAYARGEEEAAGGGKSVIGKAATLLIEQSLSTDADYQQASSVFATEIDRLTTRAADGTWAIAALNDFERVLTEEVRRFDPEVSLTPNVSLGSLPKLQPQVRLQVADQWAAGLENLGHGMRRSLVFSVLRAVARMQSVEAKHHKPLLVFLTEEPELYLHPQAERRRMRELEDLADSGSGQVILCTHSAFFVSLTRYKGILRFHRPGRRATEISGWAGPDLDPADRKTLRDIQRFDPTNAAMLFADLVVLVEGASEALCAPHIAEKLGLDIASVETVDCKGNENIPAFQRVLEALNVRYVAWLDSDEDSVVTRARSIASPTNGRVVLTDGNWERMTGIPPGDSKVHRSWKHFVFEDRDADEKITRRVAAAYQWQELLA